MKSVTKTILAAAVTFALHAPVAPGALPALLPEFQSKQQFTEQQARQAAGQATALVGDQGVENGLAFYTGKFFEIEKEGYLFKYRNYDPKLNRWTSLDPSGFPDGANNHQFVSNKPIHYLDDNGLTGKSVLWVTMPDMYGDGNFNGNLNYMGIFNNTYTGAKTYMNSADAQTPSPHYLNDGDIFHKYVPSTMQAMLNEMNGYTKVFLHTHGGYDPNTNHYWFVGPDQLSYNTSIFASLGDKITITMGTCFNGYAYGSNVTSLNNSYTETYFYDTYNDFLSQTISYLHE